MKFFILVGESVRVGIALVVSDDNQDIIHTHTFIERSVKEM